MDSMEVNKGIAAILVAGIAFFLAGTIGANLVQEHRLEKSVLDIKGAEPAATTGAPKPEALPPIAPLLAKADPAAGEKYAKTVCSACHTFNPGGKAEVGPNLYGVVGAPHGHMEGFNYSPGMKAKKGPWTFEELNEWLHHPASYIPGTRMTFAGIKNDQERANVIDFLRTLSPHPEPLPPVNAAPAGGAQPASGAAPAKGGTPATPAAPASGATAAPSAAGVTPGAAAGVAPPTHVTPTNGAAPLQPSSAAPNQPAAGQPSTTAAPQPAQPAANGAGAGPSK